LIGLITKSVKIETCQNVLIVTPIESLMRNHSEFHACVHGCSAGFTHLGPLGETQ